MARVYAVASAKGGVGKTTLTANLGVVFAAAGLDVAVVDADLGMPNLGRLLGVSADGATLHDVLAGDAEPLDAVYDGPEGVAVVPGDGTLDAYAAADPRALRTVVGALTAYDVVLVDTGAGLSHDTVLPLGLADSVVLVTTPSPDAFGDTKKTRQLADRLDVPVAGLVVTRLDREGVDTDGLAAHLDVPLLGVIPEDPLDADSTGGLAVTRDPDSAVAVAYRALADAVLPAADVDFDVPADGDGVEGDAVASGPTDPDDATAEEPTLDADTDTDTDDDATTGADDSGAAAATDAIVADDTDDIGDGTEDGGDDSTDDTEDDAVAVGELDLSSVLDEPTDEATEAFDTAFDLDEDAADSTADTDGNDSAPAAGDDAAEGGGLASMLEAVESSTEESADEPVDAADPDEDTDGTDTTEPTDAPDSESVADVVEAEPDSEERPTPDPSSAGERGVTVEADPEESADVPDAETEETASDGEEASDGEKKGGLFGRFFG